MDAIYRGYDYDNKTITPSSPTCIPLQSTLNAQKQYLILELVSRELNGVVQAMFRSMQAQEDEAHNNEDKPVTNSRDTQEVKLEQGLKIVKIFKEHTSKICILNDFSFYEVRQKTILEKKAKQQQNP
ncbi:unnamed protein product [Brassica oleracea]|uniref:YTH domain-containing family protein n=1 Tax=Brassica napus TaxID=3708 RepID=A0A816LLX4_BRANA|nr:unnamed protein product [Brassica napus]